MLKTLFTTIAAFVVFSSKGQFSFASDPAYKLRDITYVDSIFNIDKDYDFQLRVWSGSGLLPNSSLFLFSVKDIDTTIRFFSLKTVDSTKILSWIETPVSNLTTSAYWEYVNSRHIQELPSMKSIFKKYKIEEQRSYDGLTYWIELLSKDNQRGSWYYCPQSNFRNYPKAIEFKWVAEILKATFTLTEEKILLCKTAANMGFSAMLADEYKLIVPFTYHLWSGLDE